MFLNFWSFLMVRSLKPGDLASPVPALETLSWCPLGCVTLSISVGPNARHTSGAGAQRLWGGIRARQRLLMEEKNGEAEADQCSEKQCV